MLYNLPCDVLLKLFLTILHSRSVTTQITKHSITPRPQDNYVFGSQRREETTKSYFSTSGVSREQWRIYQEYINRKETLTKKYQIGIQLDHTEFNKTNSSVNVTDIYITRKYYFGVQKLFVISYVFTFLFPYCDVRCVFHMKMMFGSSLPPSPVQMLMSYLCYLCLLAYIAIKHILNIGVHCNMERIA